MVNNKKLVGGSWDVFKESQEYIAMDSKKYSSPSQMFFYGKKKQSKYNELYNLNTLPEYSDQKNFQVIYINPFISNNKSINEKLSENNINPDNAIKIRVDKKKEIYKIILNPL